MDRRDFLTGMGAGAGVALAVAARPLAAAAIYAPPPFRVRAITAGVPMAAIDDFAAVDRAVAQLGRAKATFVDSGYEVQTVRIATQPLPAYFAGWQKPSALAALRRLDTHAGEAGVAFSVGPVLADDNAAADFGRWAADVVAATRHLSFSAVIGSADLGIHHRAVEAAAEATVAIAAGPTRGEGNFRFAATCFVPPGTPFFPAGFHQGAPAISLGLESASLLRALFEKGVGLPDATTVLRRHMSDALAPVQAIGRRVAAADAVQYRGIDTSPAPAVDASIGAAIEALTGAPFGAAGTLSACAAITAALRAVELDTCGYCGLMLPVLEDPVLARRAGERRYGITELLAYSAVCGTGLDVVPVPGDTPAATIAAVMRDVAALSVKYSKPLSARLFPVPGKVAGELARFANPHLVESVVMPLG